MSISLKQRYSPNNSSQRFPVLFHSMVPYFPGLQFPAGLDDKATGQGGRSHNFAGTFKKCVIKLGTDW